MSTENRVQIFEPTFVKNFSCVGDQCPSNCCHSWSIHLDKKNYKEIRKTPDNNIKALAKKHFKRFAADASVGSAYGYIQLNRHGLCPMLDDKGWCEIHKRLGEKALSLTCQQYPRTPQYFGARVELSLSLSCPAVADEVLFNPDAMVFNQVKASAALRPTFRIGGTPSGALHAWAPILRDFSFQVLLTSQLTLAERLFLLGLTYHQIDSHLDNPLLVESVLRRNINWADDGTARKGFSSLPTLPGHKWNIFSHQLGTILADYKSAKAANAGLSQSESRYMGLQMPLFRQMASIIGESAEHQGVEASRILKGEVEGAVASKAFEALLEKAKPMQGAFFSEYPQVLLNFLLYQVYHYQFLLPLKRSPIQFFQVMMVDLLVLEAGLSGIAVEEGGLDREKVVALFSAYAKKRQHNREFVDSIETCLEASASDKLAAAFALLK